MAPAKKAAFTVSFWEDYIERQVMVLTRQQAAKLQVSNNKEAKAKEAEDLQWSHEFTPPPPALLPEDDSTSESAFQSSMPFPENDHWTYPVGFETKDSSPEEEWQDKSHLLISLSEQLINEFAEAYQEDPSFRSKYADEVPNPHSVVTPSHFRKDPNGLLYFIDTDWNPKLCVPWAKINQILGWIHDTPYENAHAGSLKFVQRLQEVFYWKTLVKDASRFADTCDICQKIKVDRRKKMGALRPAHIPKHPFATVSLDLITGLPPSGPSKFTAVLVIVDKLTKFAIIIPTHNTLDRDGFAKLFVKRVVNIFGLPDRIIADRDKRWATDFWKSVAAHYGCHMALSSSHHPQTDGQTEIVNATIEQMLRAYVANQRESWSEWLSTLAFAYNLSTHSSTGHSPNLLLVGYKPRQLTSAFVEGTDPTNRPFLPSQKAESFIKQLDILHADARNALVLAQEKQAKAYNKNRRPVESIEAGDLVLVNPHTLKLVDVEGTGKKLVQRAIGLFEVMEKINPMVYRLRLPDNYPMHPVFNLEHLKKYKPLPPEFGPRTTLPSTHDLLASPEYEVEAILGHRLSNKKTGNRRMYLVRWAGYGPLDDSWVSEYDLRNAPELKREYLNMIAAR